jgi:hypothetical protein
MYNRVASLAVLASLPLFAQAPSINSEPVYGRQAWVLQNGRLRVAALRGGGHLAEIRLLSSDPNKNINPMRVPHYPTIDPHSYIPAKHDAFYGQTPHRWLSAGYMGHLLCFPAFGPPSSEEEIRNGLGNHGEAPIVEWKQLAPPAAAAGKAVLRYGASLPRTQFMVERTITLRAGETVVRVEEWVENLAPFDRPINWMQHATFGPPFAEPGKTTMDVSATQGLVAAGGLLANSLAAGREIWWPDGDSFDGRKVSLRQFQPRENATTYYALLLDPKLDTAWFTMYHPAYRILIGYLFPRADHPWLGDWQENHAFQEKPWNGGVVARGIEFGTTPFPEGLRKSVERNSLFGTPSFKWIAGRQKLKTEFTVFLAEIPADFQGVAALRREADSIVLSEKGTGRTLRVPAAKD